MPRPLAQDYPPLTIRDIFNRYSVWEKNILYYLVGYIGETGTLPLYIDDGSKSCIRNMSGVKTEVLVQFLEETRLDYERRTRTHSGVGDVRIALIRLLARASFSPSKPTSKSAIKAKRMLSHRRPKLKSSFRMITNESSRGR